MDASETSVSKGRDGKRGERLLNAVLARRVITPTGELEPEMTGDVLASVNAPSPVICFPSASSITMGASVAVSVTGAASPGCVNNNAPDVAMAEWDGCRVPWNDS